MEDTKYQSDKKWASGLIQQYAIYRDQVNEKLPPPGLKAPPRRKAPPPRKPTQNQTFGAPKAKIEPSSFGHSKSSHLWRHDRGANTYDLLIKATRSGTYYGNKEMTKIVKSRGDAYIFHTSDPGSTSHKELLDGLIQQRKSVMKKRGRKGEGGKGKL